jgi:hypothetical protein
LIFSGLDVGSASLVALASKFSCRTTYARAWHSTVTASIAGAAERINNQRPSKHERAEEKPLQAEDHPNQFPAKSQRQVIPRLLPALLPHLSRSLLGPIFF